MNSSLPKTFKPTHSRYAGGYHDKNHYRPSTTTTTTTTTSGVGGLPELLRNLQT